MAIPFRTRPMPLEHQRIDIVRPAAERRLAGQALRKVMPRSLHARWAPPTSRRDPVDIIVETGNHRIASLLPIRYDRMRGSPFAFFRGAAAICQPTWRPVQIQASRSRRAATATWQTSAPSLHPRGRQSSMSTTSMKPCPRRSSGTSSDLPPVSPWTLLPPPRLPSGSAGGERSRARLSHPHAASRET